ncbi:DNA-directed RNA polymerase III subunit RPC6 [Fasciola gigantica]|uniref:DNA-directed RNA polymerase III subunit RPC6 n=1 Tax=Fasciola gigantica TaxID=46835 RepID=A0A504YTX3_FASGI|nr:DNA-directed RNA polymerase III subunit RPC6 [Fasciola gigantica]
MKSETDSLRERILNLFSSTRGVITQKHFEKELSDVPLTTILPVLNALQKEGLLDVLVNSDRTLSWQLREQSNVDNLRNLTDLEERLVYNAIRKAGENATSVKAISIDTKIPQSRVPRLLKALIGKKMIKELPMATGQKQKVYLLIDLEPSEKIAANTLFAGESGVDGEFVAMLRTACLKYLQDKTSSSSHLADPLERRDSSYVSVEEIHRFISNAKLCTVPMTLQDVQCVLDALKYGGELESRIISERGAFSPDDTDSSVACVQYRLSPHLLCTAGLARIPCTVCLCRNDCHPGGPINPENCKLFNAFLEF